MANPCHSHKLLLSRFSKKFENKDVFLPVGQSELVALLPRGFLRRKIISGQTLRVSHEPRADNPEDRQQALGLADRFSECGAFHEAMAKYMLVHGDPDGAEYMHNMRNGTELVGAIYASQAMDPFKA